MKLTDQQREYIAHLRNGNYLDSQAIADYITAESDKQHAEEIAALKQQHRGEMEEALKFIETYGALSDHGVYALKDAANAARARFLPPEPDAAVEAVANEIERQTLSTPTRAWNYERIVAAVDAARGRKP